MFNLLSSFIYRSRKFVDILLVQQAEYVFPSAAKPTTSIKKYKIVSPYKIVALIYFLILLLRMGSAASVETDEGVDKEKCKLILGSNFDESRFDSLADNKGCISKSQLEAEIAKFAVKDKSKPECPAAPLSKKEQWRSARNMNLIIAQDDRDLCKEMFGNLYTDALFDSIADENGCISKEQMMVELAKLKASSQGGGEETLSAQQAGALFSSKLQTGIAISCELKQLVGLSGRMIHSTIEADLGQLCGQPKTSFPFVIGHKGLHSLLQCSDGWAMMLKIGWTESELREKIAENGVVFKLVIFPNECVSPEPVLATWDALVSMASSAYPAVAQRLQAHIEGLKTTPYEAIDPENKLDTSENLSIDAYQACDDTLFNARHFLRSQFDIKSSFKGTGILPDGTEEFVVNNVAISAIVDAQIIDVLVSAPA